MTKTVEAVFDGEALHPTERLELPPNVRVRITVESLGTAGEPRSFLGTARTLSLSGPRDWASNLEAYLYGGAADSGR